MIKKHRQWLFLIFVVAAILRFSLLGNRSLWLDEAFSVNLAKRTQAEILSGDFERVHPPLYYMGLHHWIQAAGQNEAAVRFPSALISILNLTLFYFLSRHLTGEDVALLATSLLAFSSLDIWYAQEARMYAFVIFSGLLVALGLAWGSWIGAVVVGIGLTTGVYFDYTMIPLWMGISVVWLVFWRHEGRNVKQFFVWLIPSVIAWQFYQPWTPHLQGMLKSLNNVHAFSRIRALWGLPSFSAWQYLVMMGGAGLGLFIAISLFLRWLKVETVRQKIGPMILVGYALITLLLMIPRFYTIKRVLVTGWPFVILFVGWVIVHLGRRPLLAWRGLLALSALSSLVTLAVPKDNWRDLVLYLNQNLTDEEVVWIDPVWDTIPYNYYSPQIPARHDRTDVLEEMAGKDIWLVAERFLGQSAPTSDSEIWLDEHMQLVEAVPFYRLELRHYYPK